FFSSALAILLCAAASAAQSIQIGEPADGTTVKSGTPLVVEVVRPDSLESSTEVGVVISFISCPNNACPSSANRLGTILYNGPYKPQFPNPNPNHLQPNQNFRIHIPKGAKGKAQLIVTHFNLIGAGPAPNTETHSITLNVS
ncbi:hypothetical protein FIBSPDRAFT_777409, partial [Athelia psychrophila]